MNHRDIDWKVIQGAMTVLLVSLVISISLVATTWYFKTDMIAQYEKSNRNFQAISRKYLAIDEEERLIKEYYPRFIRLYNSGILGPERRLNWIETLRESGEKIQLPELRYVINSQTEYEPDFTINTGGFQIFSSTMNLDVDLLHEGDLVHLLGDLDKHALGLYKLSRCKLKRLTEEVKEDPEKPNIKATCDLIWFNIKNTDGTVIDLS